jgi:chromosome segregation ATPase
MLAKSMELAEAVIADGEARVRSSGSYKPGHAIDPSAKREWITIETDELNNELDEMWHTVKRACEIGDDTIHVASDAKTTADQLSDKVDRQWKDAQVGLGLLKERLKPVDEDLTMPKAEVAECRYEIERPILELRDVV